jgi:hypothetical protein
MIGEVNDGTGSLYSVESGLRIVPVLMTMAVKMNFFEMKVCLESFQGLSSPLEFVKCNVENIKIEIADL